MEDAMFCMKCGNVVADNARFCNACGSPVGDNQTNGREKTSELTQSVPPFASTPSQSATPLQSATPQATNQIQPPSEASDAQAKKSKTVPAIIGISLLIAVVLVMIIFFAFGGSHTTSSENVSTAVSQPVIESSEEEPSASTPTFGIPSASSVLTGDTDSHAPNLLVDNDTTTAWSEGDSGSGVGSSVQFSATSLQSVHTISIMGGFCKSESLYYKNSRPKSVTISFSDGSSTTQTLQDTPFAWQTITLEDTVQTDSVKITIESVYPGSKYDDACISEIIIQ